jgi:signal transduction histidine kinase
LTATVSVALAVVFLLVILIVREQAQGRRFAELENSITRISNEWNSSDSLREVNEDFPGVEVAVYGKDGGLISSTTKNAPPLVQGRIKRGNLLMFGIPVGANVVVGVSSWAETEAGLKQLSLVLAALWLPLTLLTAGVSWYGGGLVLRPVKELVASASMLSEANDKQMLSTTDRAEFASLADSLNQLIERVRRAASLQEQFASDAAHELRTPLALLKTRVEVNLKKDRTAEEHVNAQRAMLKQIDRLASIVGALLATARQQGGATQVEDFGSAVRSAVNDWRELTQWPASALQVDIDECTSTMSQDETDVIVRNLLENAARHSPEGCPIQLRVVCSNGLISMTVRDFGPGLTAEQMTLAFERFYRADEGRDRQDGGAGIGLAVVKRIVESHHGSVAFEPVEVGAMLVLRLPSQVTSKFDPSIRPASPEQPS